MKALLTALLAFALSAAFGQGLEQVILETYYVSDANDATDTDGGNLPAGSVTYRIFVDLAPGYEIQAVYGNENHELRLETTTLFFNNEDRGEITGDALPNNRIDENTVVLDSYVTMGQATTTQLGIPKNLDTNGSIVGGANNDGGSEGIAGGLLVNADAAAGIPLTTADGLVPGLQPSNLVTVGLDLSVFDNVNAGPVFTTNGGAWAVLEGFTAPNPENIVLIAQITTDGEFSYSLNVQLGTPSGGVEQFVAMNPTGNEIFHPGLNFPALPIPGCTSATACNFNPEAEEDNGSCIEPVPNCQVCNADNSGLILVDEDGDGVCNADEVAGCTSEPSACNYNPNATDEAPCVIPTEGCTVCNADNTGLELVDADGDGVCDGEEVAGCDIPSACNYNPEATDNDGSCIVPEENCTVCNADNTGLDLIDDDGDGVCNALENPGCNIPTACNYDPEATSNNGSCILPEENCTECNADNTGLDLIDDDGDGICNADEVAGCTDAAACNFDALATDDDENCFFPEADCTECNADNTGLDLIDDDGDGICNADEVAGCTDDAACNYADTATDDDGSCILPEENCTECNADNTGLDLIDADGDGICDGEEVPGCTDPEADNYNPLATDDDGSCEYDSSVGENVRTGVSVYPNPAENTVYIQGAGANAVISLYSIDGAMVAEYRGTGQRLVIDVSQLAGGAYFVRCLDGGAVRTTKLMVR